MATPTAVIDRLVAGMNVEDSLRSTQAAGLPNLLLFELGSAKKANTP